MDQLMLYFIIISGFIAGCLSIFDGFRIQIYRGITTESRVALLFTLIIFFIQTFLQSYDLFEEHFLSIFIITLLLCMIILMIRLYINGRIIVIYRTSKSTVVERVRRELKFFNIPFTEEQRDHSDDHYFHLDENMLIQISSNGKEKELDKYRLSFKKWWRQKHYREMKENMIEQYRKERDGEIFWKEIFLNIGLGLIIFAFIISMNIYFQ
ncbi:hypothetical protein KDN24_10990 [Bacillus sp. Bva_UNVM-123]|uniref:hypothetical protein n=1 Tax=Bacillus sp. Bva_UNVM-123 TaxID=2829798 RepID=UPI00391F9AF3